MKKQKTKKQQNKKSFFRRNYSEALAYIRESKNFIYATIAIFLFFALLGFFMPAPAGLEEAIADFVERLLRETEGLSHVGIIEYILWNNVQSSFTGLILGVFLGIFPLISTLANGYLLGFVASKVVSGNGLVILWRLLPHGIFELPALFISLGLGMKLGTFILKKNRILTLRDYLIKSIKAFFLVVLPLLIIAAIIEGSLISLLN